MLKKFKHSGAFGDLIYSMPIVKHIGGGEFYLHLNQINWIGQHYYNAKPASFHEGRLTMSDFEQLRDFMTAQSYILKFDVMQPNTEITHNLDRFRVPFVSHPGNYIDIYSSVFKITEPDEMAVVRSTPWLTVPEAKKITGRTVVINRTKRWVPTQPSLQWAQWKAEGVEQQSVFIGLPDEYDEFKRVLGWDIPYYQTPNLLGVAEIIAGCDLFIGNQSSALAIAIGLGVNVVCEARQDLPRERNECYFPDLTRIKYI